MMKFLYPQPYSLLLVISTQSASTRSIAGMWVCVYVCVNRCECV